LVEAANRWRLGDYTCRVDIDERQSEIAHVGDASLQDRERELLRAKEKAEDAADRITAVFESTIDCVVIVAKLADHLPQSACQGENCQRTPAHRRRSADSRPAPGGLRSLRQVSRGHVGLPTGML
jgi:hypothetical protein